MDFDILRKLIGASESPAASRYGDAYTKAGKFGKLGMRLASMPQEEEDVSSFLSIRPKMPDGMDPRQIYGNLYSSYGGRKMRGLLFD